MRKALVVLLLLLTVLLPIWSEQPPTAPLPPDVQLRLEQIVSSIDPQMWYLGSDVRVALLDLMTIALEEQQRTVDEAVSAATAPLLEEGKRAVATIGKMEREARVLKWALVGASGITILMAVSMISAFVAGAF